MINDLKLQRKIEWTPHGGQKQVIACKEREIVICSGRRWGKSAVCGYIAAKAFLEGLSKIKSGEKDSVKIWVVAPTYDLSRKVFEYIIGFLLKIDKSFGQYISDRQGPQIKINERTWILGKSSDTPTSLLGEELDLLIIDEAANISEKIWFDYLMPTTASKTRKCHTIFISTPRGKNWFYHQFLKAKEKNAAFHFSSLDGVEVSQEEWDRLKSISPSDYFAQNYEASFLDEAAAVFRGVRACINPECLSEPKGYAHYVGGLDLAQINDFTVLTIADVSTHNVVHIDRFNKISYPLQIARIEALAKKYNHAKIVVELNNIGGAVADELRQRGCFIEDFKTQGTISKDLDKMGSKEKVINKLAVDIEQNNIHYPPNQTLIDELEAYGINLTPGGNIQYGAPEGFHDDMVMSLALTNWGLAGKTKQEYIKAAQAIPHKRKSFQYY